MKAFLSDRFIQKLNKKQLLKSKAVYLQMPEGKFFLSLQGIQYCVEYLQAQKAKNEYLEKKEKAEKKEALLKTSSLLFTL